MTRTSRVTAVLVILVVFGVFDAGSRAIATTYYVTTSGNDLANGLTEATAWRTITRAANVTVAGDTVKVKAGTYNNEHAVIANRSGTSASPIVFEGYGGTPELDGLDGTGYGISVESSTYVEVKNFKVTRYARGANLFAARYVTLDGITATMLGTKTGSSEYDGWGIRVGGGSRYCIVRNCSVTDASAINIFVWYSNYNLIENCTSYGIETTNPVDYYIVIGHGNHNTIKDCVTKNMHPTSTKHAGHGIGIKDNYINGAYAAAHSYNNKIINCKTYGHGEHLWAAHGAYNNEFIDCTADNFGLDPFHTWNNGIRVRDGAHNNTFRNCRLVGTRGALFNDTAEGPPEVQTQDDNLILNCVFIDVLSYAIYFGNAENNEFRNCVFAKAPTLFLGTDSSGSKLVNCIVSDVTSLGSINNSSNPTMTYSNFWSNGFATPSGTGNISGDPLFANPAGGDYHLKSKGGRWDPTTKAFVKDTVTSACIDAGDPANEYQNEPIPNGDRINMGAYGNTNEASKSVVPQVEGRHVFYNLCSFDGNKAAADADDDGAVASDKTALLPGRTATFANYTSYSRGINGIMIDIADLPGTPTAADFTFKVGNDSTPASWATAAAPTSITVREGAGLGGSDRITIVWADNAIQKQWLQVTVKATTATGLASDDVFYFGNAIGETGNSATDATVKPTDEIGARNNPHSLGGPEGSAGIDDVYDFDRDKKVGPTDEIIARNNGTNSLTALKLIIVP